MLNIHNNARVMEITVSHSGKSGGDFLHFLDLSFLKLFLNMSGRQHLYKSNLLIGIMFYLFEVVFLYIIHPLVINMFLSIKCVIIKIIDFVITFTSKFKVLRNYLNFLIFSIKDISSF